MAGIQAGSAGRLSIEIVAEVARLQQDMDRVRRLVKDASGDIARNAKAANDNLSSLGKGAGGGVKSLSRDIAGLKAQLDPAWAAQQRFNQQQELGMRAFRSGAIDREQFISHMRQINAELKESSPAAQAAAAAAEREAQAKREAAQASAQAGQQAEQYIASLDREAAAIGKTSMQLKQMEIDARAAAAAKAGYADLAQQIQQAGAALMRTRAEADASTAAKERLAQETKQAAAAEQQYASSLASLRSSVDPIGAAQARLNAELDLAVKAFARGDMSAKEYERTLTTLGTRLGLLDRQMTGVGGTTRMAQAGTQQMAYQVQDLGLQFGMAIQSSDPFRMSMMALSQQMPQTIMAIQMMTGATKGFIGFMAGPWGAVVMGAVTILGSLGMAYANNKKAVDDAKLSTNAFGDAQSILGGILDLTTGKVKDQSAAFVGLARAQAAQAKIQAQVRQQEADAALKEQSRLKAFVGAGPMGFYGTRGYEYAAGVIDTFRSGGYNKDSGKNADAAIKQLERMLELGQLTREEYLRAAQAVSNYSVETENIKTYDRLADAIDGDTEALQSFLNENKKRDKASESLVAKLAREAEATETLIRGNYAAAEAYRVSSAAGKMAEVAAEAAAKGIKARGDAEVYSARELRKYVSEQAAGASANVASIREQIEVQKMVNKAVESGALYSENAAIAISNMAEQRKILNALEVARKNQDGEGEKALKQALDDLIKSQISYNAAVRETNDLASAKQSQRTAADIEKQTELQRRLGEERLKALRGLSGDALENELARINDQYEREGVILEYNTKIAEARRLEQWKYVEALEAEKRVRLGQIGQAQGQASAERTFEQNRRLTLNLADDVANIIGGRLGAAFQELTDAIDQAVPDLASDLGERFGKAFKAFSDGAKLGGAFGKLSGSSSGGAIGGGLAGAAFEEFAGEGLKKALGAFGGPLAGIAGGLIGGVIGGLMKSTPRASATVSIIAGQAMETAITGNSAKLKKIAGGMADGLIAGLERIAEQFGAQLAGDAKISVGVRKGNYRVDPTGQGITKTSRGAIDFGEDKAAAEAYATLLALRQLDLTGLSESMKRLITASDDLSSNLEKATKFQSVFDDLAKRDDPAKWAQDEITKWRASMDKIFKEAGATGDELAALERLTGIKRAEAAEEAAKAIADAERAALDRQREIRDKNIELLQAQGKVEEAEAMARQARIDDAPEYLRLIQQAIEVANAMREAEDKLAERRAIAKQNAQEMLSLQQRLAAAQGNDALVTRLERENELRNATSALVRQELLAIYAAEDLTAALEKQKTVADQARDIAIQIAELENPELARQMRLADERALIEEANLAEFDRLQVLKSAAEAAAELAETQKRVADQARDLEIQIAELENPEQARLMRLADERKLIEEANLAGFDYLQTLKEQKAAAESAAAAQKAINDEIDGLNRKWLETTGQTQAIRDLDLAALKSDEARRIQQAIWDYTDALERQKAAQEAAKAAADEYNRKMDAARAALSQAYERERGEMEKSRDALLDFATTIREFRDGLVLQSNPAASLMLTQARFLNTTAMARSGNQEARGRVTGDAQAYLDAALARSTSAEEYQRVLATVLGQTGSLEKSAMSEAAKIDRQITALEKQVSLFIDLNDKMLSVDEAIADLQKITLEEVVPDVTASFDAGFGNVTAELKQTRADAAKSDADQKVVNIRMAGDLSDVKDDIKRLLAALNGGIDVNVANTDENPVPIVDTAA